MANDLSPGFYIEELNKYRQKHNAKIKFVEISNTGPPHDLRTTTNKIASYGVSCLSSSTTESSEESLIGNYVGLINTIAQKSKLSVNYELCSVKESWELQNRYQCKCRVGTKEFGAATGPSKQEAKQLAAKLAYETIMESTSVKADPASSAPHISESNGVSSVPVNNTCSAELSTYSFGDMQSSDALKESSSPGSGFRSNQRKAKRALAPRFSCLEEEAVKYKEYTLDFRFIQDFEDIDRLGKGGFGHVFKAKHRIDKKMYAIKRVKYDHAKVEREVKALADLNHPNIVHYHYCWEGEDYDPENSRSNSRSKTRCLFIQMELCEEGTLAQWIDDRRSKEHDKVLALDIFEQITEGVAYIHSKQLIHRDLKPNNIFLVNTKQIKIGDFGLVTSLKNDEKRTSERGTWMYMSPEQMSEHNYGDEVDIFALGLILAELLHIFGTYQETNKVFQNLREGFFPDIYDAKEKILLQKLLSKEPRKRPKAPEVLKTLNEWKKEKMIEKKKHNTC
ncbi:PREDICTED: interferon-induced, double-stranded RNA-activated protein kinase [Elephantulus edwardii]|uniref:interferon-induced, double-stranded RNA-activated protein kinase n=1 Tax=Elephantulus edwardii TaxID=28737 RepID=UPI0003F07BD8|nr:PREDICTED: interferon-induced, double-stranded RNA-activated protein kinase [Elephantulus edwardii]